MQHRWSGHPQIGVRLVPQLLHAVRADAGRRGTTCSAVVRELIEMRYRGVIGAVADNASAVQASDAQPLESALPRPAQLQPPLSLADLALGQRARVVALSLTDRDGRQTRPVQVMPSRVVRRRGAGAMITG